MALLREPENCRIQEILSAEYMIITLEESQEN